MPKSKEPWGATTAGIIAGAFVLVAGTLLPLQQFAGEFSNLLRVFFVAMMGLFAWKARRYYEILGSADERLGSWAREAYDSLRQELMEGGKPAKVYANWLKVTLHQVDRFFGDAGRNDRSWFARMFGLETPGPRWTAPAFDKCLLLALVYPVLTIYIVWLLSGEVGDVEKAIHLPNRSGLSVGYSLLSRGIFGLGLAISTYVFWRGLRAKRLIPMLLWMFAPLVFVFLLCFVSFFPAIAYFYFSGEGPSFPARDPYLPIIIFLIIALKNLSFFALLLALIGALIFIFIFAFPLAFAFALADTIVGAFAGAFAFSAAFASAFSVAVFGTVAMDGFVAIKRAFDLVDARAHTDANALHKFYADLDALNKFTEWYAFGLRLDSRLRIT